MTARAGESTPVLDHLGRAAFAFARFMTARPDEHPLAAIVAALPPHTTGPAAIDHASAHFTSLVATIDSLP